ncbi:putative bifunctional diguanylate cyclase/phosphodiesterase [Methylotuvimicrobium sp.]|uniref:putative bifunctional diguanylate cyclase/phosphodiesterase n=2 Tax=Methylotuvimicrobium sp. TaxID=2822413 RepID=UPI003D65E8B3
MAYHDKLTGLPNRDLFYDRLNTAILQAKRHQVEIAVLFIDLDHFKYINDTFGHTSGDIVLQQVAARLTMCLRETDTLARMGGDEFTVVLQDFDNRGDVETTAQRILKSLSAPLILENQELYISASIGISFFPEDGGNPALLMKHADTAMYSAKNSGRKCLHFFRSSMEGYSLKRIEMEQQLRQGLERNEFKLYYQPQINLESGRIIGAEALIRWQHPEKGLLPPSQFIAIAEDTGLIEPIGEWVLREAWSQRQGWHRSGWEDFRIAVNLSAHQFNRTSLVKTIADVLCRSDIDPAILELELTETVAMQDVGKTLNILNELKKFGVQLSIDDFGTGYSSLLYLRQFPIDRLKIDRTFVANIAHNPNEAAIVVAIIAMAHSMGLEVIAEGVETKGQLSFLKMHGCNEAQGYLMGKPMSGPALFSRLQQEAR